MKTINATLKGTTPLLIHAFAPDFGQDEVVKKKSAKGHGTPREQIEKTTWKDEDGTIWMPSLWPKGSMMSCASEYKLPGTRKSLKSVLGGAVIPCEEKLYFIEKYSIDDCEIDSRPVVIQRARIMRHRARLETWSVVFNFELDEEIIPSDVIHEVLTDAGRRAGVGDFRPQKGGMFGKFQIVKFEVNN